VPRKSGPVDAVVLTHRGPDGEPVVVLSGRLGLSCVSGVRDAVMKARTDARELLRVDVSRVAAIDPAGVRTLVACRRLAACVGVELLLVRPSEPVTRRMELTGLTKVIKVENGTVLPPAAAAGRPVWDRSPSLAARGATNRR
jgi:anti-anti-sigma factor